MKTRLKVSCSLAILGFLSLVVFWHSSKPSSAPDKRVAPQASPDVAFQAAQPASASETSGPTDAADAPAASLPVAATPANRPVLNKDGILPPDFLDRIVTGQAFAFVLPDGSQAEGTIETSDRDERGIVRLQGRVTRPAAGRCFLQRQTVAGVAGPFVGNVLFDGKPEGWKIEPSADLQSARFVARHEDQIACVNYEVAPAPQAAADVEEIAPQYHPTTNPLPSYQNVISLQSIPGAIGVIYLDFDGETGPFSGWGNFNAAASGASNAQVFDVWRMVCEDYQGFNLNITTDRKVFDNAPQGRRQHVIITPTTTAAPGAGGVAYVGSYNNSGDTPCWAFYSTGTSATAVISHEVGHTLGLSHDGRTSPSEGYYDGHGSGSVSWGPIMGSGYYSTLTQWSKGEYLNANNTQDDLAIITGNNNDVDYRADDTGDTPATAKYLEIAADNSVSGDGFIGRTDDVDAFRFATTGGQATLNLNTIATRPNLDILAEIVNAATNAVVTSNNPDTGINATVSANLPAGEYLLRLRGTGRGNPLGDGYTNYGCIGTYLISGSVAGGIKPYRFSFAENPANGASIGTVAARASHGANPVNWTIASGNGSGAFSINPATGVLTVADPAFFDYELQSLNWTDAPTLELFVTITDSANPSLSEYLRVVVTVTDVNDAPRFRSDPFIGRPGIPDAPYADTLVATDQDAFSAAPTFSKVSGPGWLAVAADGTLSGTPTAAEMGMNTFTVRTSDVGGAFSDATLLINIVDVSVNPFWNNPAGGSWPVAGNWLGNGIANGSAQNGDFSTLDLTANATVTLDGARTIGNLLFADTNPSHNWTLNTGSAAALTLSAPSGNPVISVANQTTTLNMVLAGSQGFAKTGAGTLVLAGSNTDTGPTALSSGTLTFTTNTLNSTSGYSLNDANTGPTNTTLRMVAGFTNSRTGLSSIGLRDISPVTVTNNGTGTTTLDFDSTTSTWINGLMTIDKAVVLKSAGGGVRGGFVTISGNGAGAGNDSVIYDATGSGNDNNWNTYEKTGSYSPMANSYSGNVRFTGGTTIIQNKTYNNAAYVNLMIPNTASVKIDAGSGINFAWGSESFDGLNDGVGGGGSITSSSSTVPTISLGVSNGDGSFSGVISSGLSLVKAGTGTQVLGGANTYAGSTVINGGTLRVNGSIGGSGVSVASGATLTGRGAVSSTVTLNAGSMLSAGDTTPGTLTLANTVTLDPSGTVALRIAKSGSTLSSDRISLTSSSGFVYKGTLTVTTVAGSDALASGDKFILFPKISGSFSGSFNTINLPPPGTNLMWDTSGLLVDGSIVAISTIYAEAPVFSPGGGAFIGPKSVTISTFTSGSTIRYTTDGSDPTTSATAVSGITPISGVSIPAPANVTLRAYALKAGLADSPVVSATYATVPTDGVTWTNPAGGSWPVTGNWLNGVVATGTDISARFDTLDLTADTAVTLDGARTLGGFKFADITPSHNWTLATGSGGPLTLAVTSGSPVILVSNQTATINTVLAGTQGLTKTGAGTLTLAGDNTYSGLTSSSSGSLTVRTIALADASSVYPGGFSVGSGAAMTLDLSAIPAGRSAQLGAFNVASGATLNLTNTATSTDAFLFRNTTFTGSGTIRKNGAGYVDLSWGSSPSTWTGFTGSLFIDQGTAGSNEPDGDMSNSSVTVAAGATMDARTGIWKINGLNGAGTVSVSYTQGATLSLGNTNGNASFSGTMTNNGSVLSIIKNGTGTQTLIGSLITHTGTTTVNSGTLVFSKTSGLKTPITNNATVEINSVSGDDWITTGALSGTGTWIKTGAGRASFSNSTVTTTGNFQLQAGSVRNNNNSANWSGCTADMDISSGAILDLYADAIYLDQLTGSGLVQNGYGNTSGQSGSAVYFEKFVIGTADGSSTFNGVIRNNGGNNVPGSGTTQGGGIQLEKQGTGTITLAGTNTYTGTTTVTAGTLQVNGSLATGAATVATGGTLGGSGSMAGAVTNNGTLAPGNGAVGNFTVNNSLTLAPGSAIAWQISDWTGAAGSGFDKLTATSLNITATSAAPITIRPADLALAHFSEANRTFVLVQTTSGITGFSADKFAVDTSGFTFVPQGTWAVQQSGNNLLLAYTRPNSAPVFTADPITGASGTQGVAYTGTLAGTATDPDPAEVLVFTKDSGPAWLTVAANGTLGGTPGAGDTGGQSFVVRVTDSFGASATATLAIQVAPTAITPDGNGNGILDAWEIQYFGDAAPGAHPANDDPDHDGFSNLMEYSLNTNPTSGNASPIVYDTAALGDGKHLRITVPKNPAATNLTYIVETCGALGGWSAAATTIESETATELIVRDNFTQTTTPQRFIRLHVETAP
ncbi:MAG: autotransporter-associated beta strand repeat-containing protein [Luteolibacter sp.]